MSVLTGGGARIVAELASAASMATGGAIIEFAILVMFWHGLVLSDCDTGICFSLLAVAAVRQSI